MSFFRRWRRGQTEVSRPSLDERVDALVHDFVPTDALGRDRALEVAHGVLLQGCRDAQEEERSGQKTLPSTFEISEWDPPGLVRLLIDTLEQRPNAWASEFADALVDVGFRAVEPRRYLDTPDIHRLVGFAYCAGIEVFRNRSEIARRWLESDPATVIDRRRTPAQQGSALRLDVTKPELNIAKANLEPGQDVGLSALHYIHGRLLIEADRTVRQPRGFTWSADHLAQTITSSELFDSRGLQVSVVTAKTTVVSRVSRDKKVLERFLADYNMLAVGSGYEFDGARGEIVSVCRHLVHADMLAHRSEELASYALLQLGMAEHHAETIAKISDGAPAIWEHPTRGARPSRHRILDVIGEVFCSTEPSNFINAEEMRLVEDLARSSPLASIGSDASGVCVEVPFGEHNTSLIQVSSIAEHPNLGTGLGVATVLPLDLPGDELAPLALELQTAQGLTVEGGGQFGSWAVRSHLGKPCVAFCRFIPNALFRPGLIQDVVLHEISRALWADQRFHPGIPPRNAWEIMARRDGLSSG